MLNELHIPEIHIGIMNNIYYLTIFSVVVMLILENRKPERSLGWSLVLVALPVVGLILYIFFGQNVRRTKIISRKSIKQVELINGYYETLKQNFSIKDISLPKYLESQRKLISLLYKNNHALFSEDNNIKVYTRGDEAIDEMYEAIANAKETIHLQSYIFEPKDKIGLRIVELLKQKAKEGVEIRLLVDSVGSWSMNRRQHKQLNDVGIESYEFLKVAFPFLTHRVNYRNHRKILVVDGELGFVGGMNIADRYYYGLEKTNELWRDTHLKIKGSAVNGLQSTFIQDWYFASRKRIQEKRYFNSTVSTGNKRVQIASCGPDSDWRTIEQAFVLMITNAKDYIYLQSPYFLPTESIRMALMVSAMSGVDVRLMIPFKSDGRFTQRASHSYLKEMLEAGVIILRYHAGFIHSKMMVADDKLVTIGSSNMDFRSFESNFEVNAFIYDEDTAIESKASFLEDESVSYQVSLDEWDRRPKYKRIGESFARLLSPLL